jgi:rRNA-processing protein CGR1
MATTSTTSGPHSVPDAGKATQSAGLRVNGKQWHETKKPFRPVQGQTSYAKRVARESQAAEVKKIEKEMKEEKEAERQVCDVVSQSAASPSLIICSQRRITAIRDRRAAKEEKERYEKMAEKMHKKRVERLKRREKRNKMLKS